MKTKVQLFHPKILLGLFVSILAACGGAPKNVVTGNQEGYLHYGNGAEPQGLDPHLVTGVPENHIVRAIFEGLAVKNPITLEPEPGVAERWEISPDGTTYTFFINPKARWSNGEPITASDYVWSWHRALHPKTGSLNAYMLFPVVNAEEFASGELEDFQQVGIKSVDDNTLRVELKAPTPYFMQLMDHYSTFAVHPETILKFGEMSDRFTPWTRVENIVSNGPFTLKEWSINQQIKVEKNINYWDRSNVSLNGVYFYPTENAVTEERLFRSEQLHVAGGIPINKIPVYRALENSPYVQAPYLGTYYYLINTKISPVDDVRVRKALSYAVDREKLARTVLQNTAIPAYSITPPDTLGYNPPRLFSYDPQRARELLAEAGYPDGQGWPGLQITYNTQDDHRKIAIAVQKMWKEELGIDVTITNQEWKVYLNTVSQGDFQLARRGWIGDYVDANNFLDLFLSKGGNNNTGYENAEFDNIILELAPKAASREDRYRLLFEAETLMMSEMPIIPFYTYTSKSLIHPSVSGIFPNLMNSLNLKYVELNPERRLELIPD